MGDERTPSASRDERSGAIGEPPAAVRHSSPGAIDAHAGGASVVQVETLGRGGVVLLWLTTYLSAVAIVLAVMAWYHASLSERETRIFNDNVLRMEARLEAAGIVKPDEEH